LRTGHTEGGRALVRIGPQQASDINDLKCDFALLAECWHLTGVLWADL
jgi:hypothetical protein